MLRVALTGGIATGKSRVRARAAARGVPTLDADALVHRLFSAGSDMTVEVRRRFGAAVLRDDGTVDRTALGRLVFADPDARHDLEAIVHPRVFERMAQWADAQAREGAPWVLVEIPLLFETGRDPEFDRVIVAACAPDEQVRRVRQRDGLDEEAALARLAAQWPIADKIRRATDLVDTGGTLDDTDRRVDAICEAIDEMAASRQRAAGRLP